MAGNRLIALTQLKLSGDLVIDLLRTIVNASIQEQPERRSAIPGRHDGKKATTKLTVKEENGKLRIYDTAILGGD